MRLINIMSEITGYDYKIKKCYVPIINNLLNDIVDEKIVNYEVENVQKEIVRNIKIVTETGKEEEIKCTTYYDTIEEKFINFKLETWSPTGCNLVELYYNPLIISTYKSNENHDIPCETTKFVFIKNNGQDKLNVRINTEVKYKQDKLRSDVTYETDNDNIEKIIENINEIPQAIEKFTKRKTLK